MLVPQFCRDYVFLMILFIGFGIHLAFFSYFLCVSYISFILSCHIQNFASVSIHLTPQTAQLEAAVPPAVIQDPTQLLPIEGTPASVKK